MSRSNLLFCLAIFVVQANAAETPQPTKSVRPASSAAIVAGNTLSKPLTSTRLAAPKISETVAVRHADGSITFECSERANPKAATINAAIRANANAGVPQQ